MSADPVLVEPFRGERYAAASQLSGLIAPPYDVITPEQRARYAAQDPHNIVHVMLPEAADGDRYTKAAALLAAWRGDGVLHRDAEDMVYVMAQDYAAPSGERLTRLGVFAAVAAQPYTRRRVRPHERTHAGPKADRLALLRATRTNIESIFLIAPDSDRALARALEEIAAHPPDVRAELEGTRIRVWAVGGEAASRLPTLASRGVLYIADGHHRYETAVAYAQEAGATDIGASRVLALIVSAQDRGLTVLPTHRIIYGQTFDRDKLLAGWRRYFDVGRVAPCADRVERLAELGRQGTACLVAFPDASDFSLVLKRDAALEGIATLGSSPAVRVLDVARIEGLVVQSLLAAGTSTPMLTYTADPHAAFDAVRKHGAAASVLLNPTRVEQVFAVADAGDVMPQKSTYFIPKVPSGMVLRPL